jgi:hypothetical protein
MTRALVIPGQEAFAGPANEEVPDSWVAFHT